MSNISFRGGAQVGWVNASWPFAKLTSSAARLTLSSFGTYEFVPAQVVSIDLYGTIPFLASGVRINHNRTDYPEKLIFWCMGSRERVLTEIQRTGFLPIGHSVSRITGFPIRWSVVLIAIVLWNLLFMLDGQAGATSPSALGPFSVVAMLLLLGLSTAVKAFPSLQQLVLQEGHRIGEIKAFLILMQIVAGLLSMVFGGILLSHAHLG